jgi:hypothetical protein
MPIQEVVIDEKDGVALIICESVKETIAPF